MFHLLVLGHYNLDSSLSSNGSRGLMMELLDFYSLAVSIRMQMHVTCNVPVRYVCIVRLSTNGEQRTTLLPRY